MRLCFVVSILYFFSGVFLGSKQTFAHKEVILKDGTQSASFIVAPKETITVNIYLPTILSLSVILQKNKINFQLPPEYLGIHCDEEKQKTWDMLTPAVGYLGTRAYFIHKGGQSLQIEVKRNHENPLLVTITAGYLLALEDDLTGNWNHVENDTDEDDGFVVLKNSGDLL